MSSFDNILHVVRQHYDHKKVLDEQFVKQITHGQKGIAETMFKTYTFGKPLFLSEDDWKEFIKFEVRYICFMLCNDNHGSNLKDCGGDEIAAWFRGRNDNNKYEQNNRILESMVIQAYIDYGIGNDLNDKASFKAGLLSPTFFMKEIGSEHGSSVLQMLLLLFQYYHKNDLLDVINDWSTYDEYLKYNIGGYATIDWIGKLQDDVSLNKSIYNELNRDVKAVCDHCRTEMVAETRSVILPRNNLHTTTEYVPHYHYGEAADAWINNYAKEFGFVKEQAETSSGCVLKGTKILMSDGSQKNIEDIKKGDMVLHKEQGCSYCSDELIVNENVPLLYSINDDEPFMSLDHAIYTKRGWCAVDVTTALQINDTYPIYPLEIGDVVITCSYQNNTFIKKEVIVKNINIIENKEHKVCYDLHFYDGYNSYYANGFACYLNYPQITASNIMKKIEQLSDKDKQKFMRMIDEYGDILMKLFTEHNFTYVLQELGKHYEE